MRTLLTSLFLLVAAAAPAAPFGSDVYGGDSAFGPDTTDESPWPWVGGTVVIAGAAFALRAQLGRPRHWISRARARRRHYRTAALLRGLNDSFGGLEPNALRQRFYELFLEVQGARTTGAWSAVKGKVDPELLAVEQAASERLRLAGEFRRLDHLKVTGLWLDRAAAEPKVQVTALIQARAADYLVDNGGAWRRGRPVIEPFQEYWVFRRDAGDWGVVGLGPDGNL